MSRPNLAIRWTIGDVSSRGFDALRLSVAGALRLFGEGAQYIVTVNSIPVDRVQDVLGDLSFRVLWQKADSFLPDWLRLYLEGEESGPSLWKYVPLRMPGTDLLLALENDVVLWEVPASVREWLADGTSCVMIEDPANAGLFGYPSSFDLEPPLRNALESSLSLHAALNGCLRHLIPVGELCLCVPGSGTDLGSCGAHFKGLNRNSPESGPLPAHDLWDTKVSQLYRKVAGMDGRGPVLST